MEHRFTKIPTDNIRISIMICQNCQQQVTMEYVAYPEGQLEKVVTDVVPVGSCDDLRRILAKLEEHNEQEIQKQQIQESEK